MEDGSTQLGGKAITASANALGVSSSAAAVSEFASAVVCLLAQRSAQKSRNQHLRPSGEVIDSLIEAALSGTSHAFEVLLGHFRKTRVSYDVLADVYIPQAARQMGDAWLNDQLSWLDVSIATARLQSLLREIGAAWAADQADDMNHGVVLLLVPEGEQHTLGPMVAMGQLRRKGVSVCLRFAPGHRELGKLLDEKRFDGIFISVATEARVPSATAMVRLMQSMGINLPPIVVGGPLVQEKPQLMSCIDSDYSCIDITAALEAIGLTVEKQGSLKRA